MEIDNEIIIYYNNNTTGSISVNEFKDFLKNSSEFIKMNVNKFMFNIIDLTDNYIYLENDYDGFSFVSYNEKTNEKFNTFVDYIQKEFSVLKYIQ